MDTIPEKPSSVEEIPPQQPELTPEQSGETLEHIQQESSLQPPISTTPAEPPTSSDSARSTQTATDSEVVEVERILEEGLGDFYVKLPPEKQEEFRKKGELTAHTVVILLRSLHIRIGKIVGVILGWLKILPGVSKYYLEQEAKIKTERILSARSKMQ